MIKIMIVSGFLLLNTYAFGNVQPVEKIWIDTNIAIGRFGKDVDDGIALIMALRSPELSIQGISLVSYLKYGNKVAKRLLKWYHQGEAIPVYKGASDASKLGQETPAVKALIRALRKDKLTIIALGPATNIATVLLLHPELAPQIKRIVWCAGRTPGLRFRLGRGSITICDCNFDKDPQAGSILLSSGVALTLSGYEPASSVYLTKEDLQPLKNSPHQADRWLYRQLSSWFGIWRVLLGSRQGFMPFDAVTLGSWLSPDHMHYYPDIPVRIQELDNDARLYARQRKKPYLIASYHLKTSQRANYHYQTEPEFKRIILRLLMKQPVETARILE